MSDILNINQVDENNQRQGYWEEHWTNGIIRADGHYVDGRYNNHWRFYYPDNGQIWYEGCYKLSKRVGKWSFYSTNGKLKSLVYYS